jgi:MFS transporter, SET family, sugar efflux transporter
LRAYLAVFRQPNLRLIGLIMVLLGAHNASVYPYQSLIAIERIGLSEQAFSLMLVMASVAAVTTSVLMGVLSDHYGHRRRLATVTALCSATGIGMIVLAPGPLTFWIGQGLLLPIALSIYGQAFTLARLASPTLGQAGNGALGTIRSLMSAGFMAMLMVWIFAFDRGAPEMAVYLSGGLASLGIVLAVLFLWPQDDQDGLARPAPGQSLGQTFRAVAHLHILSRILFIGALAVSGSVYFVLVSLVFEASALRGPGDVALFVGMVAGWEVPFMLLLPRLTRRLPRATVLALAALVYAANLALLPFLCDTVLIWFLPLLAGAGGAIVITLPILYYQDLVAGRPGTAAALLALQKLVVDTLTAGIFALGMTLGGYGTVALFGTAVALTGAACLYLADRFAWFPAQR